MRGGLKVAIRLGLATMLAMAALALLPRPAAATIAGPCQAWAFETPTSTTIHNDAEAKSGGLTGFDVKTKSEWHVHDGSYLSGYGTADSDQTQGHVAIVFFGFSGNIAEGKGKGREGTAGPLQVSTLDTYTTTIAVTGGADSCSGDFKIVVDGKSPVATVAGGAGLGLGLLGLGGVIGVAMRRRPF